MQDLGTLGGASSQAVSINASGTISGWAQTANGSWQGFTMEPATAINDSGWIVGQTLSGRPFRLKPIPPRR